MECILVSLFILFIHIYYLDINIDVKVNIYNLQNNKYSRIKWILLALFKSIIRTFLDWFYIKL
ncbi:hypothetical protein [Tepidibacter aestuarii]|uniref:hypothetical protein n=1 Tax=Tepidibacter aestuarii TaxID=2925782 RepID=UPI0020BDDD47|nr:hypothetical protein [Tepidibacter aestuarii]CAH2213158.1 protein of unknown function [Tepidibacter aestuarii]